ncbi:MAG: TrmH family RNA methyltransferase [Caulobacterales bacterium]
MPRLIAITDPDDPRIAGYRDIRERDLVGREGRFVAEGEVVLRALARGGLHRPSSVLIAEKRLAKLAPVLGAFADDLPVYLAAQAVMDAVTGFPLHRGILAMGERGPALDADALLAGAPARSIVVCLFGLANHDNIGGVFRGAAAFGARAVLLDQTCGDPLYRKAIRVSVGAALTLPFARFAPGADPIDALAARGFEPIALSPTGGEPLHAMAPPERAALLLGTEGPGLPADLLARARRVSIPMAGAWDSLNVASAAAVALHHLRFAVG